MAGDGIPHGQLDSLCHDLTSISKGGLIHKAGGHALVGGIIPSCLSADDPKVTAMSVLGEAPDQLPLPVEIGAEMKHQLRKEIQRYGQSK